MHAVEVGELEEGKPGGRERERKGEGEGEGEDECMVQILLLYWVLTLVSSVPQTVFPAPGG